MRKFLKRIMVFVLAMSLIIPFAGEVFAGLGSTDNDGPWFEQYVTINKYVFDNQENLEKIKAIDIEDSIFYGESNSPDTIKEKYLKNIFGDSAAKKEIESSFKPLQGAVFKYIYVSDDKFFEEMQNEPQLYDDIDKINKLIESDSKKDSKKRKLYYEKNSDKSKIYDFNNSYAVNSQEESERKSTDKNGQITHIFKPKTDGSENVWIFEDLSAAEGEAAKVSDVIASPIALTFPLPLVGDNYNSHFQVFPKNVIRKITPVKTVKDINTTEATIDNVKNLDWYLQSHIPKGNAQKLTKLVFEDTINADKDKFEYKEEDIIVYLNGTDEDNIVPAGYYDKKFEEDEDNNKKLTVTFNQAKYKREKKETEDSTEEEKKYVYEYTKDEEGEDTFIELFQDLLNKKNNDKYETKADINKLVEKFKKDEENKIYIKINTKFTGDVELDGSVSEDGKGLSDNQLNEWKINKFDLKFSHNPKVTQNEKENEDRATEKIESNEPQVKTGGIKFLKYGIKENEYKLLDDAEFIVKRKVTKIKRKEGKNNESGNENEFKELLKVAGIDDQNKDVKDDFKFDKTMDKIHFDYNQKDSEYEYLQKDENHPGQFIWVKNEEKATKFTGSKFDIRGLEYTDWVREEYKTYTVEEKEEDGKVVKTTKVVPSYVEFIHNDYEIEEVKAPKGFNKLLSPVKFRIGKNTHKEQQLNNFFAVEKLEDEKDKNKYSDFTSERFAIKNIKTTLPKTGAMGTIIFIIVGLAIMGTAVVMYKKRQNA